jgi:hypothetical protein
MRQSGRASLRDEMDLEGPQEDPQRLGEERARLLRRDEEEKEDQENSEDEQQQELERQLANGHITEEDLADLDREEHRRRYFSRTW